MKLSVLGWGCEVCRSNVEKQTFCIKADCNVLKVQAAIEVDTFWEETANTEFAYKKCWLEIQGIRSNFRAKNTILSTYKPLF